ncbi:hypothetical protein PF010_g2364 [Phytophthora fragariae]|uniref:Uncharacterized protein n=2 Tax=Phytophthora fragariae TaxID=53985 RepID=A0A6G0LXW7_9STRA|nr:hypothetical protein PF010_g2364 [Phytophthora fragariae]KAE9220374.1 hypothetical protein PF004_g13358 [Phytophthora fragariae]
MSPIEMLTGSVPNLSDVVTFGNPFTAYREPGKKAWKPRAQVGVIVGENDETKGFKVHLPMDRVVTTTQHMDSKQNAQLQAQLEREDPGLRRAVQEREEATQRMEPADESRMTSVAPAGKKIKSKKKSTKKNKRANKKDATGSEGADEEVLPVDTGHEPRMRTRYMGVKHVPVARVEKIALKDPKSFCQAMKDPRADKWKQAIRDEIEALEQNDT